MLQPACLVFTNGGRHINFDPTDVFMTAQFGRAAQNIKSGNERINLDEGFCFEKLDFSQRRFSFLFGRPFCLTHDPIRTNTKTFNF